MTTTRHVADYQTDYWQMHTLATVLGSILTEDQRARLFRQYVDAAAELKAAKYEDDLDEARRAELSARYNVLLRCCYGAGFTSDDLAAHFPPVVG